MLWSELACFVCAMRHAVSSAARHIIAYQPCRGSNLHNSFPRSRFWWITCVTLALLYLTPYVSYGFGPRSGNPTPVVDLIDFFIALLVFVFSTGVGAAVFMGSVLYYRQQSSLVAALLGAFAGLYLSGTWAAELLASKDISASVVFSRWLLLLSIPTALFGLIIWSLGRAFEKRSQMRHEQRNR